MRNDDGFTLIELLIVLAIIALLAAVSLPAYWTITRKADAVAFDAQVKELEAAATLYLLDGGTDTTWGPSAGDEPRRGDAEPHDAWGEYLERWPANPLGTGEFVVRIEGGEIFVSPGRGH